MTANPGKPSSGRRILTGEDVQSLPEGASLEVEPSTILTDVAREWIEKKKIRVVEKGETASRLQPVGFALGSDHGGFEMKKTLKQFLQDAGASFHDYGTHGKSSVDYPDFAHAVALAVALGHAAKGIVVDGAGIGSAIVANKVPGIRAGACLDEASARNAREHNDINVMTLGASLMAPDKLKKVVTIFMQAELTEPRHRRRVDKIMAIENKYYRPV